jgi:chromosome segregation ATPase
VSRLREEARAFAASLRKSLETNALATRSAWANLQGLATAACWDCESDDDDDSQEDHCVTLSQLQLELANLGKIVDELTRHSTGLEHEKLSTLRLQGADAISRLEFLGIQLRDSQEEVGEMEIEVGKELELAVDYEKELVEKRDEIRSRLSELKDEKDRKATLHNLLALITPILSMCCCYARVSKLFAVR